MEQVADHLVRLLSMLLFQPDLELGQVDMLFPVEREMLLKGFNDTETEFERGKTIHGLFEEQAEHRPDNVAIVMNERQLTYREPERAIQPPCAEAAGKRSRSRSPGSNSGRTLA